MFNFDIMFVFFTLSKSQNLYNLNNVFNKKFTKKICLYVSYIFPKFDGS